MDVILLFALIGSSLFGFIDVVWKRLRAASVDTRGILAVFAFSIPLFGVLLWSVYPSAKISVSYALITCGWAVASLVSNYGMLYLYRYRGLSELNAYTFAFVAFLGLLLDLFWYRMNIGWATVLAVLALFVGGVLLSDRPSGSQVRIPTTKMFCILLCVAVFRTGDYFLFKLGLGMQENIFVHIGISQILLFALFFVVGGTQYFDARRKGTIRWAHIVVLSILIFLHNMGAGYVIDALPLVAAILSSVIAVGIYVVYDLSSKELRPSPKTFSAMILLIAGMVLLVV